MVGWRVLATPPLSLRAVMKRLSKRLGIAIACLLAFSGCSSAEKADEAVPIIPTASAKGWADEFEDARRRATTDFERKALEDDRISDAEFAEMESAFTTCMRERNVIFKGFRPGGGYEFRPGRGTTTAEANGIADECSASSGLDTVGSLYFLMKRNPQNLDEDAIMAACLVGKKVVPATYSAGDWARDTLGETYPFSDKARGEEALRKCSDDPLGLLDKQTR
ncbi:hypothetical protein [Leifsonia shinshuensis]